MAAASSVELYNRAPASCVLFEALLSCPHCVLANSLGALLHSGSSLLSGDGLRQCKAMPCPQADTQDVINSAGKYKSAGDQLLRSDMSEDQAEQLTALLDDIYAGFTKTVSLARGKSEQEVHSTIKCIRAVLHDLSAFLDDIHTGAVAVVLTAHGKSEQHATAAQPYWLACTRMACSNASGTAPAT